MKRRFISAIACCGVLSCVNAPVLAGAPDGMRWLDRVLVAARTLNYSGTFVYRSGAQSETSRIAHRVEGGRDAERLEVLDGSPREVIRNDDEVKCYLPESRTLIVEKHARHKGFPALLPASLAGLAEYYSVRTGAVGRVAERESQAVLLEPKDDLRYGRQLWIDAQSGLLLKAAMFNERGEDLETFAFTQVQIGGPVEREALKSRFAAQAGQWQVHRVSATEARGEEGKWLFRVQLPGFRKLVGMNRLERSDRPDSVHLVFSDGLAAISVFIEALPEKPQLGMATLGAVNLYQRALGDRLIVVMGEVPQMALKKLGDGIEARK